MKRQITHQVPHWNLSRLQETHGLKISPRSISQNIAVIQEKSSAAVPSIPTRPLSTTCFSTKTRQQDVAETPLTSPQHKQ